MSSNNDKVEKAEKEKEPAFMHAFKEDQKQQALDAKAFDIDDFIVGADDILTVYVAGIGVDGKGRTVNYKRLNGEDGKLLEPYVKETRYEQGMRSLAIMMFKADGKTTYEKIKKMKAIEAAAIIRATFEAPKSFQSPKSVPVV